MTTNSHSRPEVEYKRATTKAERRRLQAAVLAAYRPQMRALVRRLVPSWAREEGEHVAAIGCLLALERLDLARTDDKFSFWGYAHCFVRDEVRAWIDVGVNWRKAPNRGRSPDRVAAAQAARVHMHRPSMDAPLSHRDGVLNTMHDVITDDVPTVEEQVERAELEARVKEFAETLTVQERTIFFSENPGVTRSRHHSNLVTRAAAFVRGKDAEDQKASCTRVRVRPELPERAADTSVTGRRR